jgi:hypothetical protein
MNPSDPLLPTQQLRTMQIIAAALLIGLVSLCGVAVGLVHVGNNGRGLAPPQQIAIVTWVAIAVFALTVADQCAQALDRALLHGAVRFHHIDIQSLRAALQCRRGNHDRVVQHVEQYAHLVDMGCDYVQGYYYAPSLEPTEVLEILRASSAVPDTPDVLEHV